MKTFLPTVKGKCKDSSCPRLAFLIAVLVAWAQPLQTSASAVENNSLSIPEQLCSPYGAYPNPLGITDEDRASFHPVVKFPTIWSDNSQAGSRVKVANVVVADNTRPSEIPQMATEEERNQRQQATKNIPKWFQRFLSRLPFFNSSKKSVLYGIGRYDENRIGMYSSELFLDEDNSIDGFAGARTVHVGIDLSGPVGTPVYAFTDGVVHSLGYNAELGDYGNVIVLEHTVPSNGRKVWALYGHLDGTTIQGKVPGQRILKGQRIGRLGDIHENGGW